MIKPLLQCGFKKTQLPETYGLKLNDSMTLLVWVKPTEKSSRYSVFMRDDSEQMIYLDGITTLEQIQLITKAFAQ